MPSFNVQRYLAARASGASVELACEQSGIGRGEAELWEADIASGEVELPHVDNSILERGEGGRGQAVPALTQQAAATPGKSERMAPGNVAKQHSDPPRPDASEGRAPDPNELPRVRARVRASEQPKEGGMLTDEEAKITMKVGDGPEVPIDLKKDLNAPENAEAKEQIGAMFAKPATDTGQRLKLFIERVERLEQEIKDLNSDKSDVFQEAKSTGFDTATIKRIIKLRKMDSHKRQEAEALLETYLNAIGMTPIEHAIAMAA